MAGPIQGEAYAGGIGTDVMVNRRESFYPDPDVGSVRTAITKSRYQFFWEELEWKQVKARFFLEDEKWGFEGPSGEKLIGLKMLKVNPRFKFLVDGFSAETSVLFMKTSRGDGVYQPHAEDTRSSFVLPSLRLQYEIRKIILMGGLWREHDIVPLNGGEYALINDASTMLGAGYILPDKSRIHLEYTRTKRYYPALFESSRDGVSLVYQMESPLGEGAGKVLNRISAKVASAEYAQSGERYNRVDLEGNLKMKMGKITHFMTYKLLYRDSFSTYVGETALLTEEVIQKADLIHSIEYDAFTWLGKGPLIFAWGMNIEDSLIQESIFEWGLHLKLVMSF